MLAAVTVCGALIIDFGLKGAKDDPDYFLMLIQLAYYDQEYEKVDKQGE
jgi:hypothetical protein